MMLRYCGTIRVEIHNLWVDMGGGKINVSKCRLKRSFLISGIEVELPTIPCNSFEDVVLRYVMD